MVKSSINAEGVVNAQMVQKFSRALTSLSLSQSILALSEFIKGLKREINKSSLIVESAVETSPLLQKEIIKTISQHYKIINSQFIINTSLLGGLRVKIGDTLIDNSIRDKVDQLRERITHV
ncbi:hypothetical protein A3C32_03070 [Candidatus Daviesbacteria bacterium RIFCSPHIGHO2_02_FULL_41_14]|uniref:Uncharacterized protein n=1 Tax=Candidatus Daviesbacteria bacterium RIFCSPLOWO2_01_FULL_40_24 TaxID=1797787 RepID=A0A1F5MJ05_9BACT|nr:MAG: hypothetical protein A3C32_03070 [Candidatus Daviesbacteria bacterium RIFCSPHIGHO2_02_FULL_41_14]OGE65309.1 MAG: hypothetical protein A3B49_00405 [Candidatus Daviesbacteria bacterium RIFCSPLOWO2_01_FULL_40_24]